MKSLFITDFFNIYRGEWLKTRKTLAFWMTILFPFFCTILVSLKFLGDKQMPTEPWPMYIKQVNNVMSFFLPFFLILLVSFTTQIEYKNHGWKQLYSQPVPRLSIFLGKYLIILSLMVVSVIFALIILSGLAPIIQLIRPGLNFTGTSFDFATFIRLFVHTIFGGIFIMTLQYWLCIRLRGFMAPIIIGVFFTIIPIAYVMILGIAGLLKKGKEILKVFEYDPYSYPFSSTFHIMPVNGAATPIIPDILQIHLGIALAILLLAAIDNHFRKVYA
ncbi:MAG: ABC transporter permease [Bacteroidetes bacterium]|nr:ABC transporter permease [Bacteroidota bacterium]